MTDMTKFNPTGGNSEDLKAADFLGKNLKVIIAGVGEVTYPAGEFGPEKTRPTLTFEGKDKRLVLNPTNNEKLCNAYGVDSDEWVGKEIGLTTQEYKAEGFPPGWIVQPLGVEFDDDIPW